MKTIKIIVVAVLISVLGSSCGNLGKTRSMSNEQKGAQPARTEKAVSPVEMNVYPERNGGVPETLKITITNHTDEVVQFNAYYSIERLVSGAWQEVDLGNFAVIAIMYILEPGHTGEYNINLFTERTNYPEGDYRVVKKILMGNQTNYIYAPFRIIEPRT